MSNGFIHNLVDKCLYIKVFDVCLYLDDMLIISNDVVKMKDLEQVDTIIWY